MGDAWGGSWGSSWGLSWGTSGSSGGGTARPYEKGSGAYRKRRRHTVTREQVESWWDEYAALAKRSEDRDALETISQAITAVETSPEAPTRAQVDSLSLALSAAIKARTEAAIVAQAEAAERAAQKILRHFEKLERALIAEMEDDDEETTVLLLLH